MTKPEIMNSSGPWPVDRSDQQAISNEASTGVRPRLLFLCQTLPYPPDGGVSIRTYNILRLLSRVFEVKALCFYRKAAKSDPDAVKEAVIELSRFADVQAFRIPQEYSRLRFVWDHLRSVVQRKVYTRFVYQSGQFLAALKTLLRRERFDLVHVDSLDLSGYLPVVEGLSVICTHHNIESALLRRRANTERWPLRPYLELQAGLMEAEERSWCARVDRNAVVSVQDRDRLTRLVPKARTMVVPNGVDTSTFRPKSDPANQDGVVFVGGYSWHPNRDGMEFFVGEILPLIRDRQPNLAITWVGRSPADRQVEYRRRYRLNLTGYVDDIRPYVQSAACYVVPLRVGGGTRLKILDAWAMGKAVVSTTVGCEGLDARDGENILIRDTPESFARAVCEVCNDSRLRERLGRRARKTTEGTYEWEVIGRSMIDQYLKVIGGSSTYSC